jgi:hypothetical protein
MWYASANRDEDVFDDADAIDIERPNADRTCRSATASTSAWAAGWPSCSCACCGRRSSPLRTHRDPGRARADPVVVRARLHRAARRGGGDDHWPRFPGHASVLTYLQRFADRFELRPFIRFDTRVTSIRPTDGWTVTSAQGTLTRNERFDAVAVCNGHYAEPRVPDLPGMSGFPGALLHSHNYRDPERFRGMTVAVLGASVSGIDLAVEIGTVAQHVYWCAETFSELAAAGRESGTIERRAAIAALRPDGTLTLQDGTTVPRVDAVLLCTGYRYHFPFLGADLVRVEDNWVQPLWQDLLHAEHPNLAFVGIPFRVVPFPLFEVQARWFAHLLAGDVNVPPLPDRLAETAQRIAALRAAGVKQRHFHQRTLDCYDYLDALSDQCGQPRIPAWHRQLTAALLAHVAAHPSNFREVPIDESPRPRDHDAGRRSPVGHGVRRPDA